MATSSGRGGFRGEMTPERKAALAAGRAKREATKKRANSPKPAKSRHQMLLDGELTVADLDEEELKHFRGRDIDGEFKGRIKPIPAKLSAQIRQRLLNKMQANIEGFLPRAAAILEDIAENSEQDAARVKAVDLLLQRGAGKVPDVVRVGAEDPWDVILGEALREGAFDSEEMNRLRDGLNDLASRGEAEGTF